MQETNFTSGKRLLLVLTTSFLFLSTSFASSQPPLLGVHPLDEKYYYASEVIKCKDGSKSFALNLVNDDFCDCVDGTDEPGTSACPRGRFYCKNLGSTPQFIFSSRVNDWICDCCDGSDEYNSVVHCPNTCVMGGNVEYKAGNYNPSLKAKETKKVVDDLWETTGLKMVIIIQILLLGGVLVFRKLLRRARFRRKRQLWEIR